MGFNWWLSWVGFRVQSDFFHLLGTWSGMTECVGLAGTSDWSTFMWPLQDGGHLWEAGPLTRQLSAPRDRWELPVSYCLESGTGHF